MNKMTWENFITEITVYESNTFSASSSKITRKEAQKVAETLLNKWSLNYLDGVQIDFILDQIR